MPCDGIFDINPACIPIKVAEAGADAAQSVASGAFGTIAGFFGQAANNATTWLWQQINDATSLDLQSPQLAKEMAATAAIAAVLCVGLFLVQLVTATLRGHPGQLGRAFTGLLISFIGSAFALGATRLLLAATDALSDGVVRYTLDTNVDGLSARFGVAQLSGIQNPAAVILLSVVVLAAVVMVWGAMMIRKLMLVVAAVLAPIAFAGATADFARGWVRKWIEFVAAMIASKLLLVIILSLGVAVVNGAGQSHDGGGQAVTQLAAGSLILLLGGFAPWMAIRMFHFAGDTLYAAHTTARQSAAGAQSAIAAPQKVAAIRSQARALGAGSGGGWQRAAAVPFGSPTPAGLPSPTGMPRGGPPGPAGPAASTGGSAAVTSAAGPALAAVGAGATGLKTAVNKTAEVAGQSNGTPAAPVSATSHPSGPGSPAASGAAGPAQTPPSAGPSRQPPPPPPPDTWSRP